MSLGASATRYVLLSRLMRFEFSAVAPLTVPFRHRKFFLYGAGEDEATSEWVELACDPRLIRLQAEVDAGRKPRIVADSWEILSIDRPGASLVTPPAEVERFLRERLILPTGEDVWLGYGEAKQAASRFLRGMHHLFSWLRGSDERFPGSIELGWVEDLLDRSRRHLGYFEGEMIDVRYLSFPLVPLSQICRPAGSAPKIERRALAQLARGINDTLAWALLAAPHLGVSLPAFPIVEEADARRLMRAVAIARSARSEG